MFLIGSFLLRRARYYIHTYSYTAVAYINKYENTYGKKNGPLRKNPSLGSAVKVWPFAACISVAVAFLSRTLSPTTTAQRDRRGRRDDIACPIPTARDDRAAHGMSEKFPNSNVRSRYQITLSVVRLRHRVVKRLTSTQFHSTFDHSSYDRLRTVHVTSYELATWNEEAQ